MRIIGGQYRGKKLLSPLDDQTRPTSDRVRENIFNILSSRISFQGRSVLDLFSGTGALGIEAISRGAHDVTFVDHHKPALKILKENTRDFSERSTILERDAVSFIHSKLPHTYDIIFMDPPYGLNSLEKIIDTILKNQLVKEGGLLVIETDKKTILSQPQTSRTYGNTTIWILE